MNCHFKIWMCLPILVQKARHKTVYSIVPNRWNYIMKNFKSGNMKPYYSGVTCIRDKILSKSKEQKSCLQGKGRVTSWGNTCLLLSHGLWAPNPPFSMQVCHHWGWTCPTHFWFSSRFSLRTFQQMALDKACKAGRRAFSWFLPFGSPVCWSYKLHPHPLHVGASQQ